MKINLNLPYLSLIEQQALTELIERLQVEFSGLVQAVVLFGSKTRDDSTLESDIDVLIVVDSDDWRLHQAVSYLVTDISLKYDLFELSPRIWSVSHLQKMAKM